MDFSSLWLLLSPGLSKNLHQILIIHIGYSLRSKLIQAVKNQTCNVHEWPVGNGGSIKNFLPGNNYEGPLKLEV